MYLKSPKIKLRLLDMSLDKISEYKESFNIIDKNGIGKVLTKDLIKINKIFNDQIDEIKVKEIIKEIKTLHKEELFFEEFVVFIQKQKKIIKEMTKNKIKEKLLGKKRKREKMNNDKSIEGINEEESTEEISIRKEKFEEDELNCISKKDVRSEEIIYKDKDINEKFKKEDLKDNSTIEIEKKKILFNSIEQILKNEKVNEDKEDHIKRTKRKKNRKFNLVIKDNNIIISKKDLFLEPFYKIRKYKKKNNKSFTPTNKSKRINNNFINNILFSPLYLSNGINSRLDKCPTINIKKKKSKLINHSSENLLNIIKKRLNNESIDTKNNNDKKNKNNKNDKNKEQIFKLQKIVNNNFYGSDSNNNYKNNINYINNGKINDNMNNGISEQNVNNKLNKKRTKSYQRE